MQSRTQSPQAFWSARGCGRASGELEFCYRGISAVKQCKSFTGQPIENFIFFFVFSRVSPGDQPLAKEPDDSGYEIAACVSFTMYYES